MNLPRKMLVAAGLVLISGGQAIQAQHTEQTPASGTPPLIDRSLWTCSLCPYPLGWWGDIDFGIGWVSDASNKFGDYRGLEDEGPYPALNGEAHYRDESGHFMDILGTNLGIDSRRLDARGGKRGLYTVKLNYREIPKYRGHGAETVYRVAGNGDLNLPAGWQAATTTSEMSSLSASLLPTNLKISRKMFEAGVSWKLSNRWSYDLGFEHQTKSGTRPFGAGVFLINSSHFPVPVNFSTDRLEMGLNYNGDRGHWRLLATGSNFNNSNQSITWQNPFTPLTGTEILRASLEPDNSAYHLNLAGAWSKNPGFRLSGSATIGRMKQNDVLLPYSINPDFSDLALPRLTADSSIDVNNLDVAGKLAARLSNRLYLTVRAQHDERDNQTTVDIWTPVITDFIERPARPNRPYSFKRDRVFVSMRYRTRSGVRLQAGVEWENHERTLQSVAETDEANYFLEASLAAGSWFDLRARVEQSDRDADPFIPVEDFSLPEHPLTRKFNLAERNRDRLRLDVDFFPAAEWIINLAYVQAQDDYSESIIGLRESEENTLSVDVSWSPGEAVSAHVFASIDDIDSEIAGMETDAINPWLSTTQDRFVNIGISITAQLNPSTELGFDYLKSEAKGDIHTDSGAGEAPFPTLVNDLRNIRMRLTHQVTSQWGVSFYLEHENYESANWALDGLVADSIPSILTFGAESPDYNVTLVRAQATYRF